MASVRNIKHIRLQSSPTPTLTHPHRYEDFPTIDGPSEAKLQESRNKTRTLSPDRYQNKSPSTPPPVQRSQLQRRTKNLQITKSIPTTVALVLRPAERLYFIYNLTVPNTTPSINEIVSLEHE